MCTTLALAAWQHPKCPLKAGGCSSPVTSHLRFVLFMLLRATFCAAAAILVFVRRARHNMARNRTHTTARRQASTNRSRNDASNGGTPDYLHTVQIRENTLFCRISAQINTKNHPNRIRFDRTKNVHRNSSVGIGFRLICVESIQIASILNYVFINTEKYT